MPAQGLSEGAGEVGLAHSGGTDDKHVLVTRGEVAGKERPPDGAVKAAGRSELDVFRAGGQTELGFSKKPRQHRISPVGPLGIDQEAETLLEGKGGRFRTFHLGGKRLGHAPKPQFAQTVKSRLAQHLTCLLGVVFGTAHVLVEENDSAIGLRTLRHWRPLQAAGKDVLHASEGEGSGLHGSR